MTIVGLTRAKSSKSCGLELVDVCISRMYKG